MLLSAAEVEHGFTPRPLFSGLSFSLRAGERLLIAGPNGCGKSTLLKILAGLLRPRRGSVALCGGSPATDPAARAALGYNGHHPGLQPALSGRENLHFALSLQRPAAVAELDALAAAWGAADFLDAPARRLSEGQGRRLALIRALSGNPPVLILDEPFSGLDAAGHARLFDYLGQSDAAVAFTSHLPDAPALATRTLALGG